MMKSKILEQSARPDLDHCDCGRMAMLVRRAEGMVNVWRVECKCGVKTSACLGQIQRRVPEKIIVYVHVLNLQESRARFVFYAKAKRHDRTFTR